MKKSGPKPALSLADNPRGLEAECQTEICCIAVNVTHFGVNKASFQRCATAEVVGEADTGCRTIVSCSAAALLTMEHSPDNAGVKA